MEHGPRWTIQHMCKENFFQFHFPLKSGPGDVHCYACGAHLNLNFSQESIGAIKLIAKELRETASVNSQSVVPVRVATLIEYADAIEKFCK